MMKRKTILVKGVKDMGVYLSENGEIYLRGDDVWPQSGKEKGDKYPDDEVGWKPKGGGKDPEIDIACGPVRCPGCPKGRPTKGKGD